MTLLAAGIFAAALFKGDQLGAARLLDQFGADHGARDDRCPDLHAGARADHQNFDEFDCAANLAATKGFLSGTQSLFSMLSAGGKARLTRACVRFRLAPGLVDRLQPWYAEVTLASAAFSASGADAASGVEKLLSSQVPERANRRAFETAEQQIELFHGASREAQLASLEISLQELERAPQGYDRLVTAWMSADVTGMDRDALAPLRLGAPEIYRRLVTERNSAWLSTLRNRLDGKGLTVVVVGVGHLIGPDGLPTQLRALGYSVEGP